MKVLVMMVMMMMILMKPSSMATISPLWKGISLADSCLPESFLSLCVFCPAEAIESISNPPWVLGFRGHDIREGVLAEVGQGSHTTGWRGLGLACATWWCGPLAAHLTLSFWLLPSSDEILISGYFPGIADLQKYGVLTVLFPAES
jgi:hypothetical protein